MASKGEHSSCYFACLGLQRQGVGFRFVFGGFFGGFFGYVFSLPLFPLSDLASLVIL